MVTGATGLLGRQHCRALAAAGARVVAADLDEAECRAVADELEPLALGHRVADVTAPRVGRGPPRFGHGAGSGAWTSWSTTPPSTRRSRPRRLALERSDSRTIPWSSGNAPCGSTSPASSSARQVLGAEMVRRGSGSIVNIASTYGLVAPDQSLYRRADGSQSFFKSAAYPTTKGGGPRLHALPRRLLGPGRGPGQRALSRGRAERPGGRYFVERYAERTPLGHMARPTRLRGRALVPGERRLRLHDRREPRRGRWLYRVVTPAAVRGVRHLRVLRSWLGPGASASS